MGRWAGCADSVYPHSRALAEESLHVVDNQPVRAIDCSRRQGAAAGARAWRRPAGRTVRRLGPATRPSLAYRFSDRETGKRTKHDLKPYRLDEVAAWPFGDYVFNTSRDLMSSVIKSRPHGFHEVVDSEGMFVRLLTRFRHERIVP